VSTIPLKRIANIIAGQSPASDDVDPYDGGQPFLQGNAEFGAQVPEPRLQCSVASKVARPGDVLLSVRAPVGAVNVADQRYGIGRGLCAVRANGPAREYLWWYLQSQTPALRSVATGSTFEAVSAADVGSLRVPRLAPRHMSAIAGFLEREIAKIDALIDKQEQLIATLLEDRSATISAVITSGIDNNGHLPAGRGEEHSTPAHWSETKIRHVARLNPSMKRAIEKLTDDELVTFVPMDSIGEDGSIDVNRSRPLSEVRSGYSFFERDDVLMAKVTPCFENGKLALAANLPHPCGFATTEVTVLRPTRAVYGQFLCYVLRSQTFRRASIAEMTGAGGLKRVPDNQVRNFRFRRPPLPEQRVIVQFLDDHCLKIDSLIAKSTEMIDTLREYRSALITNAVTGKIDVREAV